MFKIWSYIIFGLLLVLINIIVIRISIFFFFFIYSEMFWIISFFFNVIISSYLNDPRFVIIGFILLLIAAIEIVFVGFYLLFNELNLE